MFRSALLLSMSICSFMAFGSRSEKGSELKLGSAIERMREQYRSSSRNLVKLNIAGILNLQPSLGHIDDPDALHRLTSIYWVQTHKEEKIPLNDTEVTTLPVAFNNILKNVAENGWDKHASVTEEKYKTWRETKKNTAFQYVDTDIEGRRFFKPIDPALYMKAELIYEEARKDAERIEKYLLSKYPSMDDESQNLLTAERDSINLEIEKFFRTHGELSLTEKMQELTMSNKRMPASIGEQASEHMPTSGHLIKNKVPLKSY